MRGSRTGERPAETEALGGSPLKAALKRPAFWGLALCFGAQSFAFTGITFHMIPLLTERGLGLDAIVAAMALIGPAQVAGRLALMVFGRRATARLLGRAVVPLMPLAMFLLVVMAPFGLAGLALFALVFGTANGIITIVRATGIAEILGARGYGAISGAMNLVLMVPRTAAPLVLAAMWERQGRYDAALWLLVSITAMGAAVVLVCVDGAGKPFALSRPPRGLRDIMPEITRRFHPRQNGVLDVRDSLLRGFSVAHAPRKIGHRREESAAFARRQRLQQHRVFKAGHRHLSRRRGMKPVA